MRGLYIIAATAIAFAIGCADKAQVTTPASTTTNAAIPARPVERSIETPRSSVAPLAGMTTSPSGPMINDRDPPEQIPASL